MEESSVIEISRGRQGRPAIMLVGGFDDGFIEFLRERGDRLFQALTPELLVQSPGKWGEEIVFSSLMMAGNLSGMDVLDAYYSAHPEIPVIISTHERSTSVVVDAMKRGAFDYVNEPFSVYESIGRVIDRAYEAFLAHRRSNEIAAAIVSNTQHGKLVTRSRAMMEVIRSLPAVASGRAPVLITGESGVGKGLIAQLIHESGPLASGPFIRLNCAAVPEHLLESELFGHTKGSFTGADSDRVGLIRSAENGSLFLDEISLMPLHLQARLLHAIEEHRVRPVGSDREETVNFRLIAAGNEDVAKLVDENRFRRDLFYRINTLTVDIPPLRNRMEDIPLLAHHFLAVFAKDAGKELRGFSGSAITALVTYKWPGNVRELRNAVERAVVLDRDGLIDADDLPESISSRSTESRRPDTAAPYPVDLKSYLAEQEKSVIIAALKKENGNVSAAARGLGIPRTSLTARIKYLKIDQ